MILKLLQRITQALENKHIPYMLSGSMAMNNYAIPRMTLDIDIVIKLQEENLTDFFSIFGDNFYLNKETVKKETLNYGMFNAIDYETGFKIDFIVQKNTEYRKTEFERRTKLQIADFDVWIVSPEDLVISKIAWIQQIESDKQKTDIQNLLAYPLIDKNYIGKWCEKLNLNTFNLLQNA